jgi:molybdopterin biosynthesis enzyme
VPGEGVLPAGGDAIGGSTLLQAGSRLRRSQLAVLEIAGTTEVHIRQPRLLVLRAGPQGDAVIDAIAALIGAAIESEGGIALVEAPRGRLEEALGAVDADADAVIVVGGTGSGRNDATIETLASVGEVVVHGIALLPAETTAVGLVGGRLTLALPGRLDAALAAWHLLGRHALSLLAGASEPMPLRSAKLTHKVTSTVGLAELVPVHWHDARATPIASGYVPLSVLAQAQGWLLVGPESEGYPAHAEVMIRPWP